VYGQVAEREHADDDNEHLGDVTSSFDDRQHPASTAAADRRRPGVTMQRRYCTRLYTHAHWRIIVVIIDYESVPKINDTVNFFFSNYSQHFDNNFKP